jgi:hypothetical protein
MEYIILDDLFGVKLWGENIFRRVYHHLSNNNYDPRRIPLLHEIKLLTDEHVTYLQGLTFDNTALNTTKLSLLVGGQYSPRGSLYFNNMDKDMQTKMEDMGNSFIPSFETILGTKLRLGDSNFRACILRYEGAHAQFAMHYDTEHPDCFRTLMMYEGAGTIPPFCYHDSQGILQKVHFQPKDGILFRGTTTHHGVYPSKDPTTKRYMVGFQYVKAESEQVEEPNLTNQLRGSSVQTILSLFLPYAAYYQMAKYLPTVIPLWTSLVGLGLSQTNTLRSVVQFYLFCCFMTMDARLALQVTAYILFTEGQF